MNVYYLSLKKETPCNDYWDYGLLNDFIDGNLWQPTCWEDFKKHEVSKLPKDERAIVVLPARHHAGLEYELTKELSKIQHVVLFLMGDEEADFKVEDVKHDSIHIWVQNPHPGRHDNYNKLGTTYPPQSQQILPTLKPIKDLDAFFSGQVTHSRREYLKTELTFYKERHNHNVLANYTEGFTQGLPHEDYYDCMVRAKTAPCPSGAVIPDSFRIFEALEAMTIPIGDEVNPAGEVMVYWDWLFEDIVPFPRVVEWDVLPGLMLQILDAWPNNMHTITAWWLGYKRKFAYKVWEQLHA